MSYSLADIVGRFGGELLGNGTVRIRQVAELDRAGVDEICFVAQNKYLSQLAGSQAGAVILPRDAADATDLPRILTDNPYLYFARVSSLLNPPPKLAAGVHPRAVVAKSAQLASDVSIAAGAIIGENVVIGARTSVGANTVIGDHARVGEDCVLHAQVTIYHNCVIGNRTILHSSCVIGADGFGFAPDQSHWE